MASEPIVALSTLGSAETARDFATRLVESGLVACVSVVPGVQSIYRWKGEICNDPEWILIIKSTAANADQLKSFFGDHHPYDTPELIILSISDGLESYLNWLASESKPRS